MQSDSQETKTEAAVLIVGAGPTGLALALSLANAGISLRIIDREERPATTSRAIGIQARTLEMLEAYGLSEELVALGHAGHAGNIYAGKKRLVHLDLTQLPSRYPFLLFLEQTETERVLTEALGRHGVAVERGVELKTFDQSDREVAATMVRGSTETVGRYSYMVGCDGAHSAVRHGLGIEFVGKTLAQNFVLADLSVAWSLPDDEFHIFSSPDGLMAIFPMVGGHRLIAEVAGERSSDPSIDELRDLVARRTQMDVSLSRLKWASHFRVNSRLATALQHDRIFLVGDAAHVHSPAGAQGMNTGIQDGLNLGWKLAFVLNEWAPPALLGTYQTERHPVELRVLRRTELLTSMVALKSAIARRVRDKLAPVVTSFPPVQDRARMMISELDINYNAKSGRTQRSPLGLKVGDRFPDCEVHKLGGPEGRRLHRQLSSNLATLLITGADGRTLTPPTDMPASVQIFTADFVPIRGASRSSAKSIPWFYLIRPDGYLLSHGPAAWIWQSHSSVFLGKELGRCLAKALEAIVQGGELPSMCAG